MDLHLFAPISKTSCLYLAKAVFPLTMSFLLPPSLTVSHLSAPPYPALSSPTTALTLRPWTRLHIRRQPCRFSLLINYTFLSAECSNVLVFCLPRPLSTRDFKFPTGISAPRLKHSLHALPVYPFVRHSLQHNPPRSHAWPFSEKKLIAKRP